jgi:hypothetical protein
MLIHRPPTSGIEGTNGRTSAPDGRRSSISDSYGSQASPGGWRNPQMRVVGVAEVRTLRRRLLRNGRLECEHIRVLRRPP